MNRREEYWYSDRVQRDMHMIVYGDGGYPILAFPTQDSMCGNLESFGIIDTLSDYLNAGQIQLFCVDTIDQNTWSDLWGNSGHRAYLQEMYYAYIVEEIVPYIHTINQSGRLPLAIGLSLGALHSAIVALRRPDLFAGTISLSGVYDASYFFGSYMDSFLYLNSPVTFLESFPKDHPYIDLYRKRSLIFCVGQGAWEDEGIRTTHILEGLFREKGIDAWCDFWGYDVDHSWYWWKEQLRYFLPKALEKCWMIGS